MFSGVHDNFGVRFLEVFVIGNDPQVNEVKKRMGPAVEVEVPAPIAVMIFFSYRYLNLIDPAFDEILDVLSNRFVDEKAWVFFDLPVVSLEIGSAEIGDRLFHSTAFLILGRAGLEPQFRKSDI